MARKTIVALTVSAVVMLFGTGATMGGPVSCAGGGAECYGTKRADNITGTGARDVIYAMRGDDKVVAGGGRDEVRGGRGNDTIDVADGVAGNDVVYCGRGEDYVTVDEALPGEPEDRLVDCEGALIPPATAP